MKKRVKVLIYVLTGIVIPLVAQQILQYMNEQSSFESIITFLIFAFLCVGIAFLIDILTDVRRLKKDNKQNVMKKINEVGGRYRYPDGESFNVANGKWKIMFETNDYDLEYASEAKKRNVVYYSLSVKEYLNWIDYIYFHFLHNVKDALKCEVIIALHYNDKFREGDLHQSKNIEKYRALVEHFSKLTKKIIGEDTIILTEDSFYKKNTVEYSEKFHNIYVSKILQFAAKMETEGLTYKQFKRKLSYVESTFPIMMLAKKRKKIRVYVLDRVTSQEIWKEAPLSAFKTSHNIFFITANSLTYGDGSYIDVHSEENTINFTDRQEAIANKISRLDLETKRLMYCLLNVKTGDSHEDVILPNDNDIDLLLTNTITRIIEKYEFSKIGR